ncbi:hypothetical protein HYFRA_00009661 [Hymenoscyphus fraxineus]|uniref:Uncharacterized protein n=1 Tax=Hymenoscyphus fraxineus TaxID=746836 RepID=A0A9N9KR26_9HELO|nr:hypothetical protein HYFRA_00009661 [Hymenoscyphus fraxineus]
MAGGAGQRRGRDLDQPQPQTHNGGYPPQHQAGKHDGPGPGSVRSVGSGASMPPQSGGLPPPLGYDPGRITSQPVKESAISNTRVELPPDAAGLDRKCVLLLCDYIQAKNL